MGVYSSSAPSALPEFWTGLVGVASAINMTKWNVVRLGTSILSLELAALAVGRSARRKKD